MARIALVTITDIGDVGRPIGAVVRDDETREISFEGSSVTRDLFGMVARETGGERSAFDALVKSDGWSNGKLAFRPEAEE